ncbi:MAG: hypothetical protein JOZ81_32410 [Chloroflexi bacterium]|nr:hypothetical protein [Chloroflexota bacterium]MBV9547302.1 hypothetical protein [Chloroflexota bacterium]
MVRRVVPRGLLLAFSTPPDGQDEAFNAWYGDEHAPARLTVPGILNARRYVTAADEEPRYMALYDLASPDTLKGPEYRRLYEQQSEREKAMMAAIPLLDRRVLRLLLDCEPWTEDAPYQMTVSLQPPDGGEDDLVAWYRQEHMPMLLAVPGWRRVRLFEQVDGTGPRFTAVHELESPAVFETAEYRAAISTPWRNRIIDSVSRRERRIFKLLQTFPRPAWGQP